MTFLLKALSIEQIILPGLFLHYRLEFLEQTIKIVHLLLYDIVQYYALSQFLLYRIEQITCIGFVLH